MKIDVLIADLFPAARAGDEACPSPALPALERLLARGATQQLAGTSLERWLAGAFGIGGERDLPLAALCARGDGLDPGAACWLRADPVHLEAHGDRVLLTAPDCLAISAAEAAGLVGALNSHFGADEIEFIAPDPRRWYARTAQVPRIGTTPTAESAGRDIEPLLPQGDDGPRWRRIMNEAQMLLHGHACNEAREARGLATINGVWVWGAGRAPAVARDGPYGTVWTAHPLAAGIAAAAGITPRPLPSSAAHALAHAGGDADGKPHLAVLDDPGRALCEGTAAWQRALAGLERDWFAPLLGGLQRGSVQHVTLYGLGPGRSCRVRLSRLAALKLWRLPRPLDDYAA